MCLLPCLFDYVFAFYSMSSTIFHRESMLVDQNGHQSLGHRVCKNRFTESGALRHSASKHIVSNNASNPMKWVSSLGVETPMNLEDAHLRTSLMKRTRPIPSETLVFHLMCRNLKPRKRYELFRFVKLCDILAINLIADQWDININYDMHLLLSLV